MADNNGPYSTYGSAQAAETSYLTRPVNQVRIRNTHATQTLTVAVYQAGSAAAAAALADATDVTAGVDDSILIPAATIQTVWKSKNRRAYVACSVLGSGSATTYYLHGTQWTDGD